MKRKSDARIPDISRRDGDKCDGHGGYAESINNTFVLFSVVKSDVVATVSVAFLLRKFVANETGQAL